MKRLWMIVVAIPIVLLPVFAQHAGHHGAAPAPQAAPQGPTATFRVTGIHCPPCVQAIEAAVKKAPGVTGVKVSQDGLAVVSYVQGKAALPQLAQTIAATPSPMPGMRFDAALLLGAQANGGGQADLQRAAAALKGVKGVRKVDALPGAVAVSFEAKSAVQFASLSSATAKAGFTVAPLAPADAAKALRPAEAAGAAAPAAGCGMGCCGR